LITFGEKAARPEEPQLSISSRFKNKRGKQLTIRRVLAPKREKKKTNY
jgi:hypothetical protein